MLLLQNSSFLSSEMDAPISALPISQGCFQDAITENCKIIQKSQKRIKTVLPPCLRLRKRSKLGCQSWAKFFSCQILSFGLLLAGPEYNFYSSESVQPDCTKPFSFPQTSSTSKSRPSQGPMNEGFTSPLLTSLSTPALGQVLSSSFLLPDPFGA